MASNPSRMENEGSKPFYKEHATLLSRNALSICIATSAINKK